MCLYRAPSFKCFPFLQLRLHLVIAILTVSGLLATACSSGLYDWRVIPASSQPEDSRTFIEVDCSDFNIERAHHLICGYVAVPANHLNTNNHKQFFLPVLVMKATVTEPRPDPIFYLQDGPGGTIIQQAPWLEQTMFHGEERHRDIVWIEPRGLALPAGNLTCWDVLVPFHQASVTEAFTVEMYTDTFFDTLQDCMEQVQMSGVDLTLFTTAQNVADVVAVAKVLDYEQINLYAFGYGGRLALDLLSHHQSLVRSAVLVSPYGSETNPLQSVVAFNTQLEHLFTLCADNNICNAAYPGLREHFFDFLNRLETEPLLVQTNDLATTEVVVDDTVLLNYLFEQMRVGGIGIQELPMQIAKILDGNMSELTTALNFFRFDTAWGVYAAVHCQDTILALPEPDIASLPKELRSFAIKRPASSLHFPTLCQSMKLVPSQLLATSISNTNVPVLVLAGEFDPVVLAAWTDRDTTEFINRSLYVASTGGHGVPLLLSCYKESILSFIDNPSEVTKPVCATGPLQFTIPVNSDLLGPSQSVKIKKLDISLKVPQVASAAISEGESFAGLDTVGFSLKIHQISDRTEAQLLNYIKERIWPDLRQVEQISAEDRVWLIYGTSYVTIKIYVGVTQLENGDFFAIEIWILDDMISENRGDKAKFIYSSVFVPALSSFQHEQ
jgi:pimeloyl-ACP methyl ester carboxylesterase